MTVTFRHQKRKSLALQATPDGLMLLLPYGVEPDSEKVQDFLQSAFADLPAILPPQESHTPEEIATFVENWSQRIGVAVTRTQIRTMRHKWGSISTAGTLTLASDLLNLPVDLIEYVVVHELLHLKFPDHRKGWQVSMGSYMKDWREREKRLMGYIVQDRLKTEIIPTIDSHKLCDRVHSNEL